MANHCVLQPLPQWMSMVRPFNLMLWCYVLVAMAGLGIVQWALGAAGQWIAGKLNIIYGLMDNFNQHFIYILEKLLVN